MMYTRIREGPKFVRYPGRDYRQGSTDNFREKKRGAKIFFCDKKGGKDIFGKINNGKRIFLKEEKRGE